MSRNKVLFLVQVARNRDEKEYRNVELRTKEFTPEQLAAPATPSLTWQEMLDWRKKEYEELKATEKWAFLHC